MRALILSILVVSGLALAGPVAGVEDEGRKQIRLHEYLASLAAKGYSIIYSSDLVSADFVVDAPEESAEVLAALPSMLRPFGLALEEGPSGSLLIVADRQAVTAEAVPAEPVVEAPIPELIVTSSLHRIEYAEPGAHTYIDADLETRAPVVADEVVRLTHRLPGTTSGGISAQSHVRGGEANEVLFLFDGLRLYEPYHLRDFQTVASIISAGAIGSIDFYTGAYPAHYGDRMSGVLIMDMREPKEGAETELALSFFNASALSTGRFGDDERGEWLVTARRGNLDLVVDVIDPDAGTPDYNDHLLHLAWEFGPRAVLSANYLASNDKIRLFDQERGEAARASYENRVGWVKWAAQWTDELRSNSLIAISDIRDRRNGELLLPGIVAGSLNEHRTVEVYEFRQDWTWVPGDNWMLSFGANLKHLDATYAHVSSRSIESPFDAILDNAAQRDLDSDVVVDGAQYAVYSELRWQALPRLTFDFGLRWDQQTYTIASNDRQISPRASILYQPSDATDIRFGWGQYYQAQEANELQISDGIAAFFPAQRAEHFVVNVRHARPPATWIEASFFRKSFRTVRPRFENVFNMLTLLPELQFDRVMIEPDKAEALGAEITLSHTGTDDASLWWLSYTWARTRDWTVDAKIERSWDQTHTLKAGIRHQLGAWYVNAAIDVHTGWPRTALYAEQVTNAEGSQELLASTSRRNAFRHDWFASVDLRVSRGFDVSRGELTAYLEISNALNRANPCCTEYSLAQNGTLVAAETHWLPVIPTLGVVWRF
jgi:hypothetical protein